MLVCAVCAIGRTVSAERVMYLEFQVKKGLEKRVCNIHNESLQVFRSLLTLRFFREIAVI